MELEAVLLERVREYESLSRWERSELGRDLRRTGLSYGEIMELIYVKKSTLATWCREVRLSDEQIEAIKARTGSRIGVPVDTNRKRREEVEILRSMARDEAETLIHDPLWVAGLILYWGEGTKGRNRLSVANTDPRALRLFVKWVRTFIDPQARFTLAMHLHEGNDEMNARRYWRWETGLDDANFIKTFIKPAGTGHRKNHLEHGVCTVRMRRASDAWNITMEWIDCAAVLFGLGETSNYN